MFDRTVRTVVPLVIFATALSAGCKRGPVGSPSDPEAARSTLRQGLDAWKSGQTPDSVTGVLFADTQWSEGFKLLSYEVQGDGERNGFDWQCRVKLSLKNAKGEQSDVRAVYNISTKPKLVVVRYEM